MTNFAKLFWKVLSCIWLVLLTALGVSIICNLKEKNYLSFSRTWLVGNAWIRVLGLLMAILVILMLTGVILLAYGRINEKVKTGLCVALIGNAAAVVIVLAMIYSGAARLDAQFSVRELPKYDDSIIVANRENAIVSDDGAVGFRIDRAFFGDDYIMYGLWVNKHTESEISFDEINYSLSTPDEKIYSGAVLWSDTTYSEAETKNEYYGELYVFMPIEKGNYNIELSLNYYDKAGGLHFVENKAQDICY